MSLSQLQKQIFYKFIRYHIQTKEPLGSKLLSKKLRKKLAVSTIRFYLRQLVACGYLENTKEFTGRIPTDKGWYFYLSNYDLKPEIKIPLDLTFDDLEDISILTKNAVFYHDGYSLRLVIKGLKYLIEEIDDKKVIADLFNLLDCLDKILNSIDNLKIFLGKDLSFSETKNLSLIAFKDEQKILGFLGHKINYYHANLTLIKRFFEDGRKTTITSRR